MRSGRMRATLRRDLNRKGMPKRKVLAAVVKLLETTYIRVGNEEYVEENGSFGLTTLRNRHVEVLGEMLKFRFPGKSGQRHEITLQNRRLARILRRCKDIAGSALFQYIDSDGEPQSIESGDVNDYIRTIGGCEFTAKDFRTWGGTCLAASFLLTECSDSRNKQTKKALVEVVKEVAAKLGNKPATCKKYYIHPNILDCYESGRLLKIAKRFAITTMATTTRGWCFPCFPRSRNCARRPDSGGGGLYFDELEFELEFNFVADH